MTTESAVLQALGTVHGAFELVTTKSRCILAFAWLCQLLCYGIMAWDLSTMWYNYQQQSTSTYAYMERMKEFPDVTVCPKQQKYKISQLTGNYSFMFDTYFWFKNYKKISEVVNVNQLIYALSGLHTLEYMKGFTFSSRLHSHDERDKMIEKLRQHLEERNMTQRQLEMEITGSFDDVILEVPGFPITNKRKIYTMIGACYSFQVKSALAPTTIWYNIDKAKFRVNRDNETLYMDEILRNVQNIDKIFFGPPGYFSQQPESWLWQTSGRVGYQEQESPDQHFETTLHLSSMRFERQNRRSSPCNHWTDAEKSECMIACYNDEFCSKSPNYSSEPCLIENANMTVNETRLVCTWLKGDFVFTGQPDHCAAHKEILAGAYTPVHEICHERCPVPCLEDVYYVVQEFEKRSEYKYPEFAEVTILYGLKRFVLVETMMFNPLTFASNFASVISVWSGFTVLGLWTIFYYSVSQLSVYARKKIIQTK